jgi:hypothetical protein
MLELTILRAQRVRYWQTEPDCDQQTGMAATTHDSCLGCRRILASRSPPVPRRRPCDCKVQRCHKRVELVLRPTYSVSLWPSGPAAVFPLIYPSLSGIIILIDGLHHSDQVDRDIVNSLKHLAPHGKLVLHDCNPQSIEHQEVPRRTGIWNGDVWKSAAKLRCTNDELQIHVVDADWGVGVISVAPQVLYTDAPLEACLEYAYLDNHREQLMNLISIETFYELYSV